MRRFRCASGTAYTVGRHEGRITRDEFRSAALVLIIRANGRYTWMTPEPDALTPVQVGYALAQIAGHIATDADCIEEGS